MTNQTITLSSGPTSRPARLAEHLYIIFDSEQPRGEVARFSLETVTRVEIGRSTTHAAARTGHELRIDRNDGAMSGKHAELRLERGSWSITDLGSKNGMWVDGRQVTSAPLTPGAILQLGHTFMTLGPAVDISADDTADLVVRDDPAVVGTTTLLPSLRSALADLDRVALSTTPVVLTGPTGTGKERMAARVHASSRRTGSFVSLNCGAMPAGLIESELFGAKRGAFSGAGEDRAGLVETAHEGTLFLDEIGDLPLTAQAVLLRTLELGEVRRVGDTRTRRLDVRVVAATHRDLEAMAREKTFREDLLARLSGHVLALPTLEARTVDIGLLIAGLLRELAPDRALTFSTVATRSLLAYAWPRNVRELRRCLERAVSLATTRIEPSHLPDWATATDDEPLDASDAARRDEIIRLLVEHDGNISAVARAMGKVRPQVQRWLARYGLDATSYKK
ncbi:MAG TPA: sigma 54-interacting transcriptional regulator [Kofleriaceae bacterium]